MSENLIPLVTPGEVLREEFMEPLNLKGKELAARVGLPESRISELVRGRTRVSADYALRLSAFFGTSAEFWLNLQSLYDLELARREIGKSISEKVVPFRPQGSVVIGERHEFDAPISAEERASYAAPPRKAAKEGVTTRSGRSESTVKTFAARVSGKKLHTQDTPKKTTAAKKAGAAKKVTAKSVRKK